MPAAGRVNGQGAEPPIRIDSREELVYLLGEASELEHGLLCEYLYAQFSLKRGVDEGISQLELDRILAWETTLIDIIKQEMLHLALATNLLTAVGAAPHFERPNFPILSRWYPADVQIALVPLGERALRHFMYLERPEGMTLEDAEGFSHVGGMEPIRVDDPQLTPGPEEWHTVGHLYRGIEAGLARLVDRYGEESVFIGPAHAQATTDIFEWPQLTAVTNLASASQAIELIVEQGEGARGDWVNSHFGRFVGVLEDFLGLRRANPGFDPARPVIPVYVHEPPDVEDAALIEDPLTRRVGDLFSAIYEVILQLQARYFVHHGETGTEVDTLAKTVKHLMNWVMRALGPILTRMPVGAGFPGKTAGPAFDILRPAFFILPHRHAAWTVLHERLESLGSTADELAREPGLSDLSGIARNLHGFAADLDQHLQERRKAEATAAR
ncbi:MAG TPA: ferritin-like domain-containing protein [Candidatus Dormibacteraeota bacterium]